jgi:hypothetical protein
VSDYAKRLVFALMTTDRAPAPPDAPYDSDSYLNDNWIFVR